MYHSSTSVCTNGSSSTATLSSSATSRRNRFRDERRAELEGEQHERVLRLHLSAESIDGLEDRAIPRPHTPPPPSTKAHGVPTLNDHHLLVPVGRWRKARLDTEESTLT